MNVNEQFDSRTIEHLIRRGQVSREDWAKHLADLPDDADEGAQTQVRFTDSYARKTADDSDE